MKETALRVRFWGTRGSMPKPGSSTLRYGGNTACVELRAADGTLVVVDCGSGAYELGRHLRTSGEPLLRGHLLISHTHWDHIQGFPFFEPLFLPETEWEIYAPGGRAKHLEATLAAQMSYDYYPVTLEALEAKVRFHDLTEGVFDLGQIRVTAQYLNHPALTLGYRFETGGAVVVYASDHEPHSLHPWHAAPGAVPVHHEDQKHVRFLEGADLVIHDAQYTLSEFPQRAGWGHTPVERAVDYVIAARAQRLACIHHDPERDDAAVDRLIEVGQEHARMGRHKPHVFAAAEGQIVELPPRPTAAHPAIEAGASALLAQAPRGAPRATATVLIVEDDPEMARLLQAALEPEELRLLTASDGASALELARQEPASLILLDLNIPVLDGLEVCRRLRADPELGYRNVPILILTGTYLSEDDVVEAFRAGATDHLTKPIKPTLVRSRVRGWLLRSGPT